MNHYWIGERSATPYCKYCEVVHSETAQRTECPRTPPTPQRLETGERLGGAATEHWDNEVTRTQWSADPRFAHRLGFIGGFKHARAQQKPAESDVEAADKYAEGHIVNGCEGNYFYKRQNFLAGRTSLRGEITELKEALEKARNLVESMPNSAANCDQHNYETTRGQLRLVLAQLKEKKE